MIEFLERVFGEFEMPMNKQWLLFAYGWIVLFIPTLITVLNKNVETYYNGFILPKLRKWGYGLNLLASLFMIYGCISEKRFIPDAKLFLVVDAIFWVVHIWGICRMESAEFNLTHEKIENKKKQEEEKEQNRLNEIENDLNEIGLTTTLAQIAEESTIEDKGSFDIGNMLDEIAIKDKKEE